MYNINIHSTMDEDPVLAKKNRIRGSVPQTKENLKKYIE